LLREHVIATNAEQALATMRLNIWLDRAKAACDPNDVFLKDEDAFEGIGTAELIFSSLLFNRRRRRNNNDACYGPI
jgi:hypothetical protein